MITALCALGFALGAVLGYRLASSSVGWTALLIASIAVCGIVGLAGRVMRIADLNGTGQVIACFLSPIVTFVNIAWLVRSSPRAEWWRAVVVIAGGAAAMVLGYLSADILGLAYLKLPSAG